MFGSDRCLTQTWTTHYPQGLAHHPVVHPLVLTSLLVAAGLPLVAVLFLLR